MKEIEQDLKAKSTALKWKDVILLTKDQKLKAKEKEVIDCNIKANVNEMLIQALKVDLSKAEWSQKKDTGLAALKEKMRNLDQTEEVSKAEKELKEKDEAI